MTLCREESPVEGFMRFFLIRPRGWGRASKAFDEAITEALADSSMATVNLGWRTSPDNGPAIGAASRLTADCCHPERSARQPAAKQGCRIQRLPYRLRLPVLLPSLPCLAVKNSLIFFQLGKDEMDQSKVVAAVRRSFERLSGQRLPVNLPVSSEFRGETGSYGTGSTATHTRARRRSQSQLG